MCVDGWEVKAGCFVVFAFWQGDRGGSATVGECVDEFGRVCGEADERMGEQSGCRWMLNRWDDEPRAAMFRDLLPEVEYALAQRGVGTAPDPLSRLAPTAADAADGEG